MLRFPAVASAIGVLLVALAVASAARDHAEAGARLDRALTTHARDQAAVLDSYFARARAILLVTAHSPGFAGFYASPGSRTTKLRSGAPALRQANAALEYLERLYPGSIGEACFIDRSGPENARVVRGGVAPVVALSPDESQNVFFGPTFALSPGQVYQARPYISPDTHEWVISNSTQLPGGRAFVHFEVTVESFRRQAAAARGAGRIEVVEGQTGAVIIDSRTPQRLGAPLGGTGGRRLDALRGRRQAGGLATVGGRRVAFERVKRAHGNANDWLAVASGPAPATFLSDLGPGPIGMLAAALGLFVLAVISRRAARRELETAASTDVLTGLGNRRALADDLERRAAGAATGPFVLAIFDLDGFKSYNDRFGHPAGDALLARLGRSLAAAMDGRGSAYRMGGDEFCVVATMADGGAEQIGLDGSWALCERGEAFEISASHGVVVLPDDAKDADEAMRLADSRMYEEKHAGRRSPGRQTTDALLRVLHERNPDLGRHLNGVTENAVAAAHELGLSDDLVEPLAQAAALHDVGKVAVPDAILNKPGPLDPAEWDFIRNHTLIGQRICEAAPSLSDVGAIVRSCHERWDGTGYPDGLAGEDVPEAARIIAVCDAYDAMVSKRPYQVARSNEDALAELRRCAGGQFDPAVVDAFCAVRTRATTASA
ncbi:MAG TPA: diguanylate cyclase [Solirubrobacteraceae bacterium]|nr:diguanylate cyclase [Solirubrobacteraceae bacterium]